MRLLHVDSSKAVAGLVQAIIKSTLDVDIAYAGTAKEALRLLDECGEEGDLFDLAILGLNLPDANDGEIVDMVLEYQVPSIIFTARFDEEIRDLFVNKPGVVDYVVKESHTTLRYLAAMVRRIANNSTTRALVAEKNAPMRTYLEGLLRQYQFNVLSAADGHEALALLEKHRDIKLVVTSHDLDHVDGFELTKKIRETWDKDELVIIGASGENSGTLPARFIKTGANDFIAEPFLPEEFFCRISQNMDLVEKTKELTDAATKDFLTGLYNRRFFFSKGQGKLTRMQLSGHKGAVAILDIDHFKSVNDTFGHDAGDEVLKGVASQLLDSRRDADLVARLGGEEFAIILEDIEGEALAQHFESVRATIEGRTYDVLKERANVTSSFGVVPIESGKTLDELLNEADALLYEAKQSGRNKVTLKGPGSGASQTQPHPGARTR